MTAPCSTCGGVRAGFRKEWWYVRDGQVVLRGEQADVEQAQRDAGGAGRIERRVVRDA